MLNTLEFVIAAIHYRVFQLMPQPRQIDASLYSLKLATLVEYKFKGECTEIL